MIAPANKTTSTHFSRVIASMSGLKQAGLRACVKVARGTVHRWWNSGSEPTYRHVRSMVHNLPIHHALSILVDLGGQRVVMFARSPGVVDQNGNGHVDSDDLLRATTHVVEFTTSQLSIVVGALNDGKLDDIERAAIDRGCRSIRQSLELLEETAAAMPSRPERRAAKPLQITRGDR